jgi:hypothetical protein
MVRSESVDRSYINCPSNSVEGKKKRVIRFC